MESVPHHAGDFRTRRFGSPRWLLLLLALVPAARASNPTPIRTIYVLPGSHWDLGFLRPPAAEKAVIKPHLDAVIAACEADPQFRWTIESGWQLQAWLERTRDPAQIRRLAALLHSGQIELSAAYGSMHTEFMGAEELNRLVADGTRIEQKLGVHPTVAMMNDVPGFSLRVPQVLARSGIRYLITGSNIALGGGTDLWPGKVPFYWQSPDGSQVLTWQTQGKNGGYTEGMADYYLDPEAKDPYLHTPFYPKEWKGLANLEIMQRGVDKLLRRYAQAGYRRSAVAVFFMHDGIGPEYELKGLLPNVRAWNAAGRTPRIVVATPSEFFAGLQADDAPVYQGDWSGLWSAVKLNSPAMSADARVLQQLLPEDETLWSLLKVERLAAHYPRAAIRSDYAGLFEYDEHNGAGQGGWPKVLSRAEVLEQNKEYADALRAARLSATTLLKTGLRQLAPMADGHGNRRTLVVYNPQSWNRSELVSVPGGEGSWVVRDAETGAVVATQQLASGKPGFEAREVPALGFRTYWLQPAGEPAAASGPAAPTTLESPYFRVELNPATGEVVSLTDLRAHRVVTEEKNGGHAGTLMLDGKVWQQKEKAGRVVIHRLRGAVVDEAVISRPGTVWPETVISLPQSEPEVRFTELLDRSRMRVVANSQPHDLYSFAFAFSFKSQPQLEVDDGEGLYRFPNQLLPGARRDAVVPRHTLAWNDRGGDEPYHVLLAEKQSFYNRIAQEEAGRAGGSDRVGGILADAMFKSDQAVTRDTGVTTFKTYEPGYPTTYPFSFALTSGPGEADAVAAHQFGSEDDAESVELPPGHRPAAPVGSMLSLSASDVIVEAMKPSADGSGNDFMLRLREIAGRPAEVDLHFPLPLRAIAETTMTEDRVLRSGIESRAIHLSPYQTLTLRLTVASGEGN